MSNLSVDSAMTQDAYLVAVKDRKGVSTGYSRCSLCNAEFGSRPNDPGELAVIFAAHVGHVHRSHQRRIESISETSARVVKEAISKLPKK